MIPLHADNKTRMMMSAAELIALRTRTLIERRMGGLPDPGAGQSEEELACNVTDSEFDQRLAGLEGRAWARLVKLFALSPVEADLLQLAVAVAVEPALGPLIARAQGAEGRFLPTEPLVKRLHGHPGRPIWRPTSALSMWRLVISTRYGPGEPAGFEADPRIVDWLFGTLALDATLLLAIDAARQDPLPPEWPVQETAERLDHALKSGTEVRLVVRGRAGTGRRAFAAAIARSLGRDALVVDPAMIPISDWIDSYIRVQRFALYADVALVWREGGSIWPAKIPMAPIQIVCSDEVLPPVRDGAADLEIVLPEPGLAAKAGIWSALVPALAAHSMQLAAIPGLSLGDLKEVGRAAPRTLAEAAAHLRVKGRARMREVGQVIDPRFDWNDLILPSDLVVQLRRITFEARTRPTLMENPETARLFEGAAGLSALFAGPPGVGKSMAAQVIAQDLGVNLLVIDLAVTTSKFIGETAKNLSNAFAKARAAGAALIFEEADAFFARRTDVKDSNDRHANADTNHLLQLLETHDGLVILSTNRRSNIDPAFIRRLRHVVEFPKPGPGERRYLWKTMLAALGIDPTALLATLDSLANSYDLSPAQIKSAALSARYAALETGSTVTAAGLEAAAGAELTKEGRSVPVSAHSPRRQRSMLHG
ncbi:ATP-binding protein [Nitrosospira sp. Nsp13]|uniref:ATP-binding protein n=1 Tax=Nitrosospira sp. Nsp13 TaxID=1855332 RepID=UPI00088B59E1|nr:ATP-binding protein [Nitrosospira sp. Nsp13]SCX79634.1 ATPase family associated with various cellular activities (AAA) [Nitrosospira sp. Nsp13]